MLNTNYCCYILSARLIFKVPERFLNLLKAQIGVLHGRCTYIQKNWEARKLSLIQWPIMTKFHSIERKNNEMKSNSISKFSKIFSHKESDMFILPSLYVSYIWKLMCKACLILIIDYLSQLTYMQKLLNLPLIFSNLMWSRKLDVILVVLIWLWVKNMCDDMIF